jgi:sulfite exporter TauE/SafE
MAMYGLGTLPVLVALGLGAGRVGPALQKRLTWLGALVVLLLAAQLGLRGAATLGWIGHWRLGEVVIF